MAPKNPLLPRVNSSLLPEGAWDTHHHIFPTDKYPLSPTRTFTPAPASLEACVDFHKKLGISYPVLAHGLSFGTDLTSLLDFLRYFEGSARAIGVVDHETISLSLLKALHAAGMRAVRINYPQYKAIGNVEKQISLIRKQAACIKQVGWALQIQDNNPHLWTELYPVIKDLPVPVITDHFAYLKGRTWFPPSDQTTFDPLKQPGIKEITALMRSGDLWIKLSAPYRVSNDAPLYEDLEALTKHLVAANPRRILWGSDWPHAQRWEDHVGIGIDTIQPYLQVDNLVWLSTLKGWLSEEEFHLMMVTNPKELFD